MNTSKLVIAEILCRPANFVLCLLAVVTAAALFIAGPTLLSGYAAHTNEELSVLKTEADKLRSETEKMRKETDTLLAEMDAKTKRIMRDLGVNLRIVHKDTNLGGLHTDFVAHDFSEDAVHDLAKASHIESVVHVVATLQHKMKWQGQTVLLVGTLPVLTTSQKNEEKPHMVKPVEPGTVVVGYEIADVHKLKTGDGIDIEGHSFVVAKVEPQYDTIQDVQLLLDLHDAQRVLGEEKEGKISQILALSCKCEGDRLSVVRAELEQILPFAKVSEFKTQAEAREKQRDLVEQKRREQIAVVEANLQRVKANHDRQEESRQRQQRTLATLIGVTTPLVVLVSALFIGLMTWLNVRERRTEVGLLRALGKGSAFIFGLFLTKALIVGLIGGAAGSALGYGLAMSFGGAMEIPTALLSPSFVLLAATVLGAPLVAAMASYLPTLRAVTQDPAVVLMDH